MLVIGCFGCDSSDSKVFVGMDDIDDIFEIGVYIIWEMYLIFVMDFVVFIDVGNMYEGWLVELMVRWGYFVVSDFIVVVISVILIYGDVCFNDIYYGVDFNEVSINWLVYCVDVGVN